MAAPDTVLQYGQIFLGQRGSVSQGQLKISPAGFLWKRNQGGRNVEVKMDDIDSLHWTKSSRGCQLGVRVKEGITFNFLGFRDKDMEGLNEYCKNKFTKEIAEQPMSTSGRNWGGVAINGKSMMFLVDGKVAFEVPLPDVAQAQQVKDDVMLEFHVDDTGPSDEREDMLAEIAFHVPAGNEDFPATGEEPAAKTLLDNLLPHTDTGAASTDEAACSFADVAVLAPRGRFEVEMFLGHMHMLGQTQDFKIRYASIQRIFILPKPNTPYTLVVVSLDPPIRKGQTYYSHILCQFNTDEEASVELDITPEQLAAKNEKCGGKLEASMSGPVYEVFARALRGLSAAKITKPGAFRNAADDGVAIRCSYKADDGHLYPLERAFFYVHKPPMLIPFEEVASVEFARQGGGAVSSRTFDLIVRTKHDQEHQFRNINRTEWQNLLDFFKAKKLRIENLQTVQQGPDGRVGMFLGDEDEDPGMRRARAEAGDDDEDEDEDFDIGADEAESDDEDEDSDDAEMIAEEGITAADIMAPKADKGKKRKPEEEEEEHEEEEPEEEEEEAEEEEEEEKKPAKKARKPAAKKEKAPKEKEAKPAKGKKAKKDPNAPKKALSAFMFFSNDMREQVKKDQPDIKFGEVGKVLGEKWKSATAEAKAKYEKMAADDKIRYQKAMAEYKGE